MKPNLTRISNHLFHVSGSSVVDGPHSGLRGNCTDLRGDCTALRGDCTDLRGDCTDLRGDCSGLWGDCSGLSGNCSGLSGDCTGLSGNCTDLRGDLNDCEISDDDRINGLDISSLCQPNAEDHRPREARPVNSLVGQPGPA